MIRNGRPGGLLVERPEAGATAESFRTLTGSDKEYDAWQKFYGEVGGFAQRSPRPCWSRSARRAR